MSKKERRKARTELANQNFNLLVPLDVSKIGTKDDPCFGKFNDPTADECKRCGDFEICSIVQSQFNHTMRKAIEAETPMKVANMPEVKPTRKATKQGKLIKRLIKEGKTETQIINQVKLVFKCSSKFAKKLYDKYK